jgi:hypothetical protein
VVETRTYGSGDYTDFDFDLSAYVGKEVIIAIGIYRQTTVTTGNSLYFVLSALPIEK